LILAPFPERNETDVEINKAEDAANFLGQQQYYRLEKQAIS